MFFPSAQNFKTATSLIRVKIKRKKDPFLRLSITRAPYGRTFKKGGKMLTGNYSFIVSFDVHVKLCQKREKPNTNELQKTKGLNSALCENSVQLLDHRID